MRRTTCPSLEGWEGWEGWIGDVNAWPQGQRVDAFTPEETPTKCGEPFLTSLASRAAGSPDQPMDRCAKLSSTSSWPRPLRAPHDTPSRALLACLSAQLHASRIPS
eukprot:scaffold368_cov258-Pinguiococcus_pyrenoidosus.AAC.30